MKHVPPANSADDFFDPPNPCEEFVAPSDWENIACAMHLTPRELQVARSLFEDRGRKSIARQLECNLQTVRAHIDRIFEKLAVKSRMQFTMRVVRVHLTLKKQK
jgi:DNA-binding NarL/FixJ family response regulator